ncbi:branched-chain amino acid transport system II carrier protein [Inconstantimicrobium porci]|uniref:Branched-chain amino acid transport system carrier protein n=1 Tax=Inconstantimicrobium porci TaxID=2652291 RepID=A0A7X2MXM8_9CLOT|nr:branched-chain amino acid transport system II carrier protein [Inconstantimicrobium porci]MDD6772222.1 branched-chain amino acid transport system II carrier protein [Inconstantimicrobium porci]MSR90966.1 branched-chain amino acid transport system II carrier protein [Inconstantimicrobium porci]
MKKTTKDAIVIGFALFSMFFGAGNLIFPGYLGMQLGSHFAIGMIGFLITGVGLPLLAILACTRGDGTFESIAEKINKKFAIVFASVLFLAIGPLLAVPRTAATTFEIAVNPFFPKIPAVIVILVYFLINLYFVIKRSTIIDTIGKFLTPALLLLLVVLIVKGIAAPIGNIVEIETTNVFATSLLEGYQTMDAIAALLFAAIITSSIKNKGYNKKEISPMLIKSSIVAVIGLAFVYGGLMYIGAQTGDITTKDVSKTGLLLLISKNILGRIGPVVIGISMGLACLSTSIGLITAGSDFFETITNGRLKYKYNAIVISIISFGVALLGVDKIIVYSAPILNLLYPVSITIMVTAFLTKSININAIRLAVYTSLVFSILLQIPGLNLKILPLSAIGFGWVIPTIVALIFGAIIYRNKLTT